MEDLGLIPGLGRSSGEGKSYPYSGLENSMNCIVHGLTELDMTERLSLLCLTLLRMHVLQPARLLCPWDFPGKNLEWVAISFSRGSFRPGDLSDPGIKPISLVVPELVGRSLPLEPPGKPPILFYKPEKV